MTKIVALGMEDKIKLLYPLGSRKLLVAVSGCILYNKDEIIQRGSDRVQVSEKLIRPLTEVKYLNADNVSRYRCIMRIFLKTMKN